jgi:hypothetical protein
MPCGTPKTAFFRVQFHPFGPQAVVYVCLNGPLDVVYENMLHTPLVRSTRVSVAKWHRYVEEHPERRDEGGPKLIGFLHLYLVVP